MEMFKETSEKQEFGRQLLTYLRPLDTAAFAFQSGYSPARWRHQHTPLPNDDVDILMINSCLVELGHVSGHIFIDSF